MGPCDDDQVWALLDSFGLYHLIVVEVGCAVETVVGDRKVLDKLDSVAVVDNKQNAVEDDKVVDGKLEVELGVFLAAGMVELELVDSLVVQGTVAENYQAQTMLVLLSEEGPFLCSLVSVP